MQRSWLLAATMVGACLSGGCSLADRFGDRATLYNSEVENVHNQALVMNVVRAAYRLPMHFTDLPTITGQANVSGGFGTTFPLAGPASGYQINPTATVSGGPTFNMAALNTAEFQKGITNPIPTQLLSYYIQVGVPRPVLLTLLLVRIEIDVNGETTRVDNYASSRENFEGFQHYLGALIDAGLTVVPADTFTPVGPTVSSAELRPETVAKLQEQKLSVRLIREGHDAGRYEIGTAGTDHVFCFGQGPFFPQAVIPEEIVLENRCDNPKKALKKPPRIRFVPRSTENAVRFLGELARLQLGLQETPFAPTVLIRTVRHPKGLSNPLFTIRTEAGDPSLTVGYRGTVYSVPISLPAPGPSYDHSTQLMALAEQLLALNSSAKDLPSPNVITVVGH